MTLAKRLLTAAAILAAACVIGWTQPALAPSSTTGEVTNASVVLAQMGFRPGFGYWGGWGWGYGGSYNDRYYIVAEKRGPEVMYATFHYMSQVNERLSQLATEKADSEKFNASVRKDLTGLRSQLGALKSQLASERDAVIKKDLQLRVDSLSQAITAKEATIRPPLHWVAAGPFLRRAQVDEFVVQLEQEVGASHVHAWKASASPGTTTAKVENGSGY